MTLGDLKFVAYNVGFQTEQIYIYRFSDGTNINEKI